MTLKSGLVRSQNLADHYNFLLIERAMNLSSSTTNHGDIDSRLNLNDELAFPKKKNLLNKHKTHHHNDSQLLLHVIWLINWIQTSLMCST